MAAGNSAFSLQGSNPNNPFNNYKPGSLGGYKPQFPTSTSPYSRTLNSAQGSQPSSPSSDLLSFLGSSPKGLSYSGQSQPAPQSPPAASTPLKKSTTTNVDGSSVTHEYHAPTTPGLIGGKTSSPSSNPTPTPSPYTQASTGLINTTTAPETATATNGLNTIAAGSPNNLNTINANNANTTLQNLSKAPSQEVQNANQAYNKFSQSAPYITAAQYNPSVAADVASGRSALVGQTTAAETQALATGVSNALAGQDQQITAANEAGTQSLNAQGQQISAGSSAGSLANTAQSNKITGLTSAGNLTPEALRFGGAGGGLDPATASASLAQKVISGQMTYDDAVSSLGYAGSAGQQFLNNAIRTVKPDFNIPVSRGQAAANQSNTTTAGTAATNAAAATYGQNYPKAIEIQGYLKNVQDLGNLLINTATGSQINPFDLTYANDSLNAFKSKLSDSGQAQFNNTLATYQGAVSQLLSGSTNVNPTQVAEWTKDIADGSMKLSTLKDVYNQALKEGNIKLSTAQQQANIPGSQLGAPTLSGGQAGTQGRTAGGNSYTIVAQ